MSKARRAGGVNGAAWFYAQPGFHQPEVRMGAMTKARAEEMLTWAEQYLPPDDVSRVNQSITNAQAIDIMRKGMVGVDENGLRWKLMARNIERLCACFGVFSAPAAPVTEPELP